MLFSAERPSVCLSVCLRPRYDARQWSSGPFTTFTVADERNSAAVFAVLRFRWGLRAATGLSANCLGGGPPGILGTLPRGADYLTYLTYLT